MKRHRFAALAMAASLSAFCNISCFEGANAVPVNSATSARFDYAVPPDSYNLLLLGFFFAGVDGIDPGDTIAIQIFDSNNTSLATAGQLWTFPSQLTYATGPVSLSPILTTSSFYAILTAPTGSFDVIGANGIARTTSGQQHFIDGALVPLPATLPLFASAMGIAGLIGWRRKRKVQQASNERTRPAPITTPTCSCWE